jgi:signal transduction histidine kinase
VADVRPLDRLGSIKVKLGVLVVAACGATAVTTWYGLVVLGWLPRFTVPVALAVALGVTQVLAHGMTSPLRELTAAARSMARGDYSRRVTAPSRDEVGEAARAFNRMAQDLASVDRERRELVANVSHELRTPISALQAVLENMVDGVTPTDPATLRTALEQVERLGRLVTSLLDLSRIDAAVDGGGVAALSRTDVPLEPFLQSAVRGAAMTGRDVAYEVEVSPPELTAFADPERLYQVVANLLDNASRHSPAGGVVRVSARPTGTGVRIGVHDEGPGIPPAERDDVFARFTRGRGTSVSDGGTGLGLAIARWVVDLHGGDIAVADTGPGCSIHVDLPGSTR